MFDHLSKYHSKYRQLLMILGILCVAILLSVSSGTATNFNGAVSQNTTLPGVTNNIEPGKVYLNAATFATNPSQPLPNLKWLEFAPEIPKDWNVVPVPGNPSTIVISPKWIPQNQVKKAIVGLIPRKSDVFGVSLSTTLTLFKQRNLPAVFTVTNYGQIKEFGRALLDKAKSDNVDLILTIGSVATELVNKHFRGEKIPVVTSASKDPVLSGQVTSYDNGSGNNVAFTSISPPFDVFQTYLLQLKPSLKNIAILYESFNVSAVETQVKPMERGAIAKNIRPLLYAVQSADTAKQELEVLLPRAIEEMSKTDPTLENSIFLVTGSTSVFAEMALINKFSRNATVITTLPNVVKEGEDSATLAIGAQMQNVAYIASLYAIDILNGITLPGSLPVGVVSPPDIAISFLRTKKIGLKIPFNFFELASFVYDYEGKTVRAFGQNIVENKA